MSIPINSLLNKDRALTVHENIGKTNEDVHNKTLVFLDQDQTSFLAWPPCSENGDSIVSLGRALYIHLLDSGILDEDTEYSRILYGKTKTYHCVLQFELTQHKVVLKLAYQFREEWLPISLTVTKEELLDYLNSKMLGLDVGESVERRIKTLMKLVSYKCFIDDLELELT